MPGTFSLERAGRWLLNSGIQEPSGGVARFYRSDIHRNKPVSTEITGYVASTLVWLYEVTGDEAYLARARKTTAFLVNHAWDQPLQTFPFEHPSPSSETLHRAYFFDCGIIVRGLLAVWRVTREPQLLETAQAACHGMLADFHSGADYHPILELPAKTPEARTGHWSRSAGCYQLKSALAWWEVAEVTGDEKLSDAYLEMLDSALASHRNYPAGAATPHGIMDRLHPYCYFLEGLTPVLNSPACARVYAEALAAVARYLRELAPGFVRSDVYAQLLRARIYAAGVVPLDRVAAAEEAAALTAFQASSDDPRIDGAFLFGRREGQMSPHANPVSTAFASQALEMWRAHEAGVAVPCRQSLI